MSLGRVQRSIAPKHPADSGARGAWLAAMRPKVPKASESVVGGGEKKKHTASEVFEALRSDGFGQMFCVRRLSLPDTFIFITKADNFFLHPQTRTEK